MVQVIKYAHVLSLSILCFCYYCKWRGLKFLLYILKILFQFSYDKTEFFKNIGLTSSNFLNSLVTIGFFWQNTLDFQYTVMIMSSTNNNNFIFSFPICRHFVSFSCPFALARTFATIWTKVDVFAFLLLKLSTSPSNTM